MFEELNQHRAAVEEQIQKGFEIGFTGNELEKAHNVGDIHPNGKWVWTQLPSGRYDWRVIKKTSGNAATSAPQATANGKKSWDNASDFSINGSDEARLVANWSNFMKRKDPHYMNVMCEIFQKKFPAVAKWVQTSPNTGVSEIRAIDSNKKEVASLDLSNGVKIPEIQKFMDACDKVKKESSISQQQTSEGKKTEASGSAVKMPASYEEAVKMGRVDTAKVNAYKMPTTIYGAKSDLETYRGGTGRYNNMYGAIEVAENNLHRALNRRVTNDSLGYKSEKEKLEAVQAAADKLATEKAIEKRISKIYGDLKKLEKQFLSDTGHDFTEEELKEWLKKYNAAAEPAARIDNTWRYSMGRIGSTSATIQIGKGKDKPLFDNWGRMNVPSWRPIGMIHYSVPNYYGGGYIDVNIPVQSWDDVENGLSNTESFRLELYKHPKQ